VVPVIIDVASQAKKIQ